MTYSPVTVWHLRGGTWQRAGQSTDPKPVTSFVVNPGGSIQSALTSAGAGGTVLVNNGTYALTSTLTLLDNQTLWLDDGVVVDGGVTLTGWTSDGAGHWYASGFLPAAYSDAGQCEVISGAEANACQKREDVFRDAAPLKQYMVLADLVTGGYFADYSANRVYVADDPTGHAMLMSKTQYAINSTAAGVTLRGGTFQHFATPSQNGAVTVSGDNWTIRKTVFQWNHAIGLRLNTVDSTYVTGVVCKYNQQLGMGHYKSTNSLIEDCEFAYNNNLKTYFQADWEAGGFKATYSSNCKIRRCHSHHNQGVGMWWDIDNYLWTIGGALGDGNLIEDNFGDGIRWEISFQCDISYNTIQRCGRGMAYDGARGSDFSLLAVAGVNVNSSPDVHIHHNTISNNENGVGLQMRSRGTSTTYGVARDLHNCEVDHNTITQQVTAYVDPAGGSHAAGTDKGFGEGVTGIRALSPIDPSQYGSVANNRFHDNTYVFGDLVSGTAQASKARFSGWNGTSQTYLSFANWKAQAGMDTAGSSMTSTTG